MSRLTCLIAVALALSAAPALAEKPGIGFCPPGLAKKDPNCLVYGHGWKHGKADDRGDDEESHRHEDGPDDRHYAVILDPARYSDWCDSLVVRRDGHLYRVNRDSGRILDLLGPVSGWTGQPDHADYAHCPPGLAKKNPPCLPPGQARKYGIEPLHPGDRIPDDRVVVIDPSECKPVDRAPLVRAGNDFFRRLSSDDKAILVLTLIAAAMK